MAWPEPSEIQISHSIFPCILACRSSAAINSCNRIIINIYAVVNFPARSLVSAFVHAAFKFFVNNFQMRIIGSFARDGDYRRLQSFLAALLGKQEPSLDRIRGPFTDTISKQPTRNHGLCGCKHCLYLRSHSSRRVTAPHWSWAASCRSGRTNRPCAGRPNRRRQSPALRRSSGSPRPLHRPSRNSPARERG